MLRLSYPVEFTILLQYYVYITEIFIDLHRRKKSTHYYRVALPL